MIIRKPTLFVGIFSVSAAAISAYINLAANGAADAVAQPHWMIVLHIGSAFIGALLLASFIVASPTALQGPTEKSSYGVGMVPRIGAVKFFIPGRNSFFSGRRSIQLIAVLFCLMLQFVSVASSSDNGNPDYREPPARMNAAAGTLAT
jgi:hypothetical protein